MVVVSGQDQPKWVEATKYRIPEEYIELKVIEELTAADGRDYLQKAGISESELATAIIKYAEVREGLVHPFLLGLCVDVAESAKAKGENLTAADFAEAAVMENKPKQLIERLLRYVDTSVAYAVHALSACRVFNFEIYQYLGKKFNFSVMQPDFNQLIEFSFVLQDSEKGEGWYRIHDLLRRLDRENPQETHLQAHNALGIYWQEQNDIIQVIYHLNCVDWERGVNNWVEVFEEALRLSQYDVCRSLLTIRTELTVSSDFRLGYISYSEGKYFAELSLYDAAQKEFTEAIESYDRALSLAPEYISALNNKGLALQSLGELQAQLSNHSQAIISYEQAIESYDRALSLAPEYIQILNNKGVALQRLGELQAQLSNHPQAIISYEQAIESYD